MAEPRPRRGHGEDSMYFDHANNYWVADVSLGYKAGKRVRRKVTGRTKTEVKTKLRNLRRDLDSGVRSSATSPVGNALDDWLANGLSGRSDRTEELYTDTVKPLKEQLGEVKLKELTAGDVQETLDALAGRLSTRSVQIVRNCLERAIQPEWRCLGCPELRGHTTQLPGSQELTALLGDMSCYGRENFLHLYSF